MGPLFYESKKHIFFREAWGGYILGSLYLLISLQSNSIDAKFYKWIIVQQDIRSFGATLTAFLIAVGLPRLFCFESENGTESLIRTSDIGCFYTWSSKVLYTVVYCGAVVFVIGVSSLLMSCGSFGFEDALSPVEECMYFQKEALPPMSNITYCILQYIFLFLGALYFSGFVLILAAITKRTALTIFLSGVSYIICLIYDYAGHLFYGIVGSTVGFFYRYGFGGYLLHSSYSWNKYNAVWGDVWKPILLVFIMIGAELTVLWFIWRCKARK